MTVGDVAVAYVKLALSLGEIDPAYVDAYYGPADWRDEARREGKGPAQIEQDAQSLIVALDKAPEDSSTADPALRKLRVRFLKNQLGGLTARAAILRGQKFTFDDEARALYDVTPPHRADSEFDPILKQLDALLPAGKGSLPERYQAFAATHALPPARLEAVLRAAVAYLQLRGSARLGLPKHERVEVQSRSAQPWTAHSWYQGKGFSTVAIDTDRPVDLYSLLQLAMRESYPGHHARNVLLERDLVDKLGWPEYQVYSIYSPQAFVADGLAEMGSDLMFNDEQRLAFERELFDIAKFDQRQLWSYDRISRLVRLLREEEIDAARQYLEGDKTADETLERLQKYTLVSAEQARQRLAYFDQFRSKVITSSYGEDMIRQYVEAYGDRQPGSDRQWQAFLRLLGTPRIATDLSEDQ